MTKVVILDRDGVINFDSEEFIKSPQEWSAIPGSLQAIAKLNKAGIKVVVATNQSGVAREYFDLATLSAIHKKMEQELSEYGGKIDKIFVCPHGPDDDCICRKPKIGMLLDIEKYYAINLTTVFLVGDALRDIQAATAAGCKPILVRTGKGEKTLADLNNAIDIPVFSDLAVASNFIIKSYE